MNLLVQSTSIDTKSRNPLSSNRFSFIQLMLNQGNAFKTRKLLDRAIISAAKEVLPTRNPPVLSPSRWVWQLAASYHLTHSTARLMQEAAQRFAAAGRWPLAEWAYQKAHEEHGHDQLALLDIQSMGYRADVVEALAPPGAIALLNFFTQSVQTTNSIGCVGYCYAMERLAMNVTAEHIRRVEAALPPGTCATRCLRTHSSIGSDVKHVEETVDLVAGLTVWERTKIVAACYQTALLYFSSVKENAISETQLEQLLNPWRLDLCNK